jgi:hypothetical protein
MQRSSFPAGIALHRKQWTCSVWKEMVSATMAMVKIKRIAGEHTVHQLFELNAIGSE